MVNHRKIGVNSNFLPNVNDRGGREMEAVNLLSSGSRSVKISSPSKRSKIKNVKYMSSIPLIKIVIVFNYFVEKKENS